MSAEPMPPDVAENAETQEGYIVSAVLGLLALLMGFTFALAVDRVETRRMLVLEEANAIGTTYLRGQLLDDPHRSRISSMLVDYTGNRISIGRPSPEDAHKLVGARKRGAEQVLSFRRPV